MVNHLVPWTTGRAGDLFGAMSREMERARREVDSFLATRLPQTEANAWFAPALNLSETDAQYEVTLDVPGLKAEDFNIELKDGQLWITGERKYETRQEETRWHRVERFHGQFRRVVKLAAEVDHNAISAEYRDGVLHITLPKVPEAQPRRIEVKG